MYEGSIRSRRTTSTSFLHGIPAPYSIDLVNDASQAVPIRWMPLRRTSFSNFLPNLPQLVVSFSVFLIFELGCAAGQFAFPSNRWQSTQGPFCCVTLKERKKKNQIKNPRLNKRSHVACLENFEYLIDSKIAPHWSRFRSRARNDLFE
jgi:hypothetical protein